MILFIISYYVGIELQNAFLGGAEVNAGYFHTPTTVAGTLTSTTMKIVRSNDCSKPEHKMFVERRNGSE